MYRIPLSIGLAAAVAATTLTGSTAPAAADVGAVADAIECVRAETSSVIPSAPPQVQNPGACLLA